tara:strand:+ start:327 stop:848 length:522 start_codon:yes stop_codon:yes gene_type:complete
MTKKATNNHGAAKSGIKSENRMELALAQIGYNRLYKKEHFLGQTAHQYDGTIRLPKPKKYFQALTKRTNNFMTDGLARNPQNNRAAMLESKYSGSHGTTEEKVFYDLQKIKDGVYNTEYPLVYLFHGPICEQVNEYRLFADLVEEGKYPNVHVIFDSTPDLSEFKNLMRELLG